jgi:hypothetical protein
MLHFTDGVSIDTSGDYRPLKLKDGWYVVGHGMSIPGADAQAAHAEIKLLTTFSGKGPAHKTKQGAQYCSSCGQDAVTCQGCGKTVCGDVAVYAKYSVDNVVKHGNFGPCCLHSVRRVE